MIGLINSKCSDFKEYRDIEALMSFRFWVVIRHILTTICVAIIMQVITSTLGRCHWQPTGVEKRSPSVTVIEASLGSAEDFIRNRRDESIFRNMVLCDLLRLSPTLTHSSV